MFSIFSLKSINDLFSSILFFKESIFRDFFNTSIFSILVLIIFLVMYVFRLFQIKLQSSNKKNKGKKDKIIETLLIVGFFQIKNTRIPPHAIVTQTVEAARLLKKPNLCAFINAVLRGFLRSGWSEYNDENEEVIYNHPQWIINTLKNSWPDNWREIIRNNNKSPR